jgi:hypothetical protein
MLNLIPKLNLTDKSDFKLNPNVRPGHNPKLTLYCEKKFARKHSQIGRMNFILNLRQQIYG